MECWGRISAPMPENCGARTRLNSVCSAPVCYAVRWVLLAQNQTGVTFLVPLSSPRVSLLQSSIFLSLAVSRVPSLCPLFRASPRIRREPKLCRSLLVDGSLLSRQPPLITPLAPVAGPLPPALCACSCYSSFQNCLPPFL